MKRILAVLLLICSFTTAKDEFYEHDIASALESKFAKKYLLKDITLQFSKQTDEELEPVKSQRRSNKYRAVEEDSFGDAVKDPREDNYKESCEYVFVKVLVDLQTAAKNAGKSSVVNIQGNFKDKLLDSKDKFQCVVGNMATAVALKANLK